MSTALFAKTPFSSPKLHGHQTLFPNYPYPVYFPKRPSRISCSLIEPDGGRLVELVVPVGPTRDSRLREAAAGGLPRVRLSRVDLEWTHVLSEGWASPLNGFMRESEFLQTLHFNSIRSDRGSVVNMSVPIVLAIDEEKKREIGDRRRIVLVDEKDKPVAILNE